MRTKGKSTAYDARELSWSRNASHSSSKLHTNLLNFAAVCAAVSVCERLCIYSSISECTSFCIFDLQMTMQWGRYAQVVKCRLCVCVLGIGHSCVCTCTRECRGSACPKLVHARGCAYDCMI